MVPLLCTIAVRPHNQQGVTQLADMTQLFYCSPICMLLVWLCCACAVMCCALLCGVVLHCAALRMSYSLVVHITTKAHSMRMCQKGISPHVAVICYSQRLRLALHQLPDVQIPNTSQGWKHDKPNKTAQAQVVEAHHEAPVANSYVLSHV